ncbi:response regulator [Microbacterium sp. CFBP9034]|uniref:response regulator n=1 Tax=Microbacterium sp. CFBP9034 TaxID=3096540 RepID=UPI002A6A6AF8|nr:response regulator [Microbacterium sp. CFBP9034]MDY0909220.1 response regulator [Microbacterium sp. CFBP9034]
MIGVLLVDDDALTLELHRTYVGRLDGFEVVGECTGARAAIAAVLERPGAIDLVLLDVTMPDGTGLDVLRHVRARCAQVDVIAITGVRDSEVVRQMVGLGVAQYLVKPFTFAVFRERLEQYREYRRRADESAGTATQAEIDALLGALRPSAPVTMPKGLSVETLTRVTEDVRAHGPVSAGEAAQRLGMSRVSARRYLEHLAETGRVIRSPRYGTPGRPESEYGWSGGSSVRAAERTSPRPPTTT